MQADPQLEDIPVIIVTSKTLEKDEIYWLNRHATGLVQKGANGRADLITAIERRLVHTQQTGLHQP